MSRAAVQDPLYGYQSTYSTHMGHPTGLRAGEGRRPSRLLQMRDDYQRRILQEKEEKMVNMYEENQRKNVERVERLTRGPAAMSNTAYPNSRLRQPGHLQPPPRQQGHQQSPSSQTPSSPSLREFFRERRELETKGGYVPQINQHYKHSRSRIGSGNSHHKHSAGVDRGQPLAPIKARHGGVSSAPALPISHRPRLFKQSTDSPDIDNLTPKRPSPPARNMLGGRGRTEKMSDFQQWQMEQNRAREDRLKKLNLRTFSAAPESEDWGGDYEYEDEEEKNGTLQNEALQMQEQELLQRIAKQQAELERLRQQREEEEELVSSFYVQLLSPDCRNTYHLQQPWVYCTLNWKPLCFFCLQKWRLSQLILGKDVWKSAAFCILYASNMEETMKLNRILSLECWLDGMKRVWG